MWSLAFLLLLLTAGVAGGLVALRDTIAGGPIRVPTRRELLPPDAGVRRRR